MGETLRFQPITENNHELIILFSEITELVRLRKEMKEYQDELEHLNDRLYRESITDEMTGLFNRKHILELLAKKYQERNGGWSL